MRSIWRDHYLHYKRVTIETFLWGKLAAILQLMFTNPTNLKTHHFFPNYLNIFRKRISSPLTYKLLFIDAQIRSGLDNGNHQSCTVHSFIDSSF